VRRGVAASALALLDIVGYVLFVVIASADAGFDLSSTVLFGGAVAGFSVMGALLIRRVPANPIGALLLATGTAQAAGLGLLLYGGLGGSATPPWPGSAIVAALGDVWYTAPFVIALVGIPLLFPDGRLPSRRFRWVVRVTAAGIASTALAGLAPLIPGVTDPGAIAGALALLSVGSIIFGIGGAGAAIWARFRRGDPVQRQQLKWLLADAGVAVVAFPVAMVLGGSESWPALAAWTIGFLAYLAMPVTIGIAVLRYRLYDIDRIISRTIGYAVVTVTLAVVFAGANLLFQAALASLTAENTVAVAASTLVVAALFQPLRRRVQGIADRRFNRAQYSAERTVAAFAAQLRNEVVLESLGSDVLAAVAQTVAPATVGLWLRRSEARP
jgi:hypothetical protein